MSNINYTDPDQLAGAEAAAREGYRAADEYQGQAQGQPVPQGDTHPLVPDGKNGRYPA